MSIKNNLIIIEGLTGLGKSTMAHFVNRQLDRNQVSNFWIHEGELLHPLIKEEDEDLEPKEFSALMLARWQKFLEKCRDERKIAVVEACLFNNVIETLFANNVEREELIAFGRQMEAILCPCNPAFIYLKREDIPSALAWSLEKRGESFRDFVIEYVMDTAYAQKRNYVGYEGMVRFWEDLWAILDEIYQGYSIDKIEIDSTDGDWARCNIEVLTFLGLAYVPDAVISKEEAAQFVGDYQLEGSKQKWWVWYDEGGGKLVVNKNTVLIPMDEMRFVMRSFHFEMVFSRGKSGEVLGFEVQGKDIDYLRLVGVRGTFIDHKSSKQLDKTR
jgi:hypothetical protein